MTADIKEIFLVDCHGPFGFNFLVTAVYLLTIYVFVLLENHKRRVRGPASISVTIRKMPLSTTFYNFIEVLDGPFTMVLFIGYKNNSDCYQVGRDHEAGSSLCFAIDKRRENLG